MSAGTAPATRKRIEFVEVGEDPTTGRRRWRQWAIVATVVALLAWGAIAVFDDGGTGSESGGGGPATSLVTVTRQSLSQRMQVSGVLGYAGSYPVLGQASGTVTWLPQPGQVVGDGQVLYRVDDVPVVLLLGSIPAWRGLAEGTTGRDVAQLNRDLVALGYMGRPATWTGFSAATKAGVEKLQQHLGVHRSGALSLGGVVFLPTSARVTTLEATLGAPATGPVLHASSTARTVSVALEADLQSEVKTGDRVTVTLPDGGSTTGTVSSVGTVATPPADNSGGPGGNTPTVPVTILPTDLPTTKGGLDQALVLVSITTTTVDNALTVPVNALLALAGGGYAVEIADPDGAHRLLTVSAGLFDDATGLVQVTGPGLTAGQLVVVPTS